MRSHSEGGKNRDTEENLLTSGFAIHGFQCASPAEETNVLIICCFTYHVADNCKMLFPWLQII